jgi:phosphonate transport system substrate-binding protein
MLQRRSVLAVLGGSVAGVVDGALIPRAAAQDWRAKFPELRLGVSSAENEAGALERNEPLARYLTEVLGVPVKTYRVTDYAGLVEAMGADKLEFARFGPAVYSLGRRVLGDKLQPLFRDVDKNGAEGYYSVVAVKADSSYMSVADLKGKSFVFADPNSTSGYAFPRFYLKAQGFDPSVHFATTSFSGSHENSVIAVARGQYEACATFWTNDTSGMIQRVESKGVIPKGSLRVIWTSPIIPASPFCVRADLPEALKAAFVDAMFAMKDKAPDAWKALTVGEVTRFVPAKHEDYGDVVTVLEALEKERKKP